MIRFIDWWRAEKPEFPGAGALDEAAAAARPGASRRAIARLMVIQAAADAIGDPRRPVVDGATAASYVVALVPVDDPEAGGLFACLAALQKNDIAALATALRCAGAACALRNAESSARAMAWLSYKAALEVGAWEDAMHAARLLERLALMDENPVAARRWAARADTHALRT